ncbi:membrane traffic protein [Lithospermum erythrorhizon]|uniref:Membrane traffic protein n=1 Tax=Lithospermum erythrorhizon TaxID=34254 RepID=A0AAV3QMX6_LITER
MAQFEAYFQRADLDRDGRITGAEAVGFFKASNLSQNVLAQIWNYADHNKTGFLGRQEFYNALKLVTVAQSKRELTPETVKAALHGPASAKIPPPQINFAVLPNPQSNVRPGSPVPHSSSSNFGPPQNTGIRAPQDATSQQNQFVRPPRPPLPGTAFHGQQVVAGQGASQGSHMAAPRPSHFLGGRSGNTQPGIAGVSGIAGSSPSTQPSPQPVLSKLHDSSAGNKMVVKDSKALAVTGDGSVSDSLFGDVFSITPSHQKQDSKVAAASSSSNISSTIVTASRPHPAVNPGPVNSLTQQPLSSQNQQNHSAVKSNQHVQASNAFPVAAGKAIPGQAQPPWPKMTQADVQKYSKVFFQVDTDRDGKITGDQARHLFLSWRLPREILKQVWDLSDQDNDSMLTLREFCVALYLMERFREGRPLPSVVPSNTILSETLLPSSGPPTAAYANTSWRPSGIQHQHACNRSRPPVPPLVAGKPPRAPLLDEPTQPSPPKPKVPVLEKHLLKQLSKEEQNALNTKFQEASDAEKKVAELEKEIMDAREKIQFYHAKMQELILYKSRCDNRLNEIIERISGDKQEVETLAKKYELKYKQSGDVASKLTIEESTFRDIQDKKMELYRAIVKLDQDESVDKFQDNANHIQSEVDELVKSLNERCKTYGLRGKPISLLELPFGWQHGIQEGAADWAENWDKFEDEGFTIDKELTLDVQNVLAPPKPKIPLLRDKSASAFDSKTRDSPIDSDTLEKLPDYEKRIPEDERTDDQDDEQRARSPLDSPARSNAIESQSNGFQDSQFKKDGSFDGSPRISQSEHNGAEPVRSGDKAFDEHSWGTFDTDFDADAAWDANPIGAKDEDLGVPVENSFFGSEDWGLNPIKTGTTRNNTYPKQGTFFDSVPSTPNTYVNQGPFFDSVPSTPNTFAKPNAFFDSVPSTPNTYAKPSTFFDSVPSTPAPYAMQSSFFDSVPSTPLYNSVSSPNADNMFQTKSPFPFADSVPSTPMVSGNSPRGLGEGLQGNSFDSFSRFDSFNLNDSGPFASGESLSRFDSMRSTRDSDHDQGLFSSHEPLSRFDSFRSTADSEYNPGAFPQKDSFSRFDSFRSTADSDYNPGVFPQREPFTRFDSMSSTRDSNFGNGFQSFDDADHFGSSEPFKTSLENQTPMTDSESWKAFR